MDLPDDSRPLVSPFNKARFLQMPFFSIAEMTKLFERYRHNINPEEIPLDLQTRIMFESGGHAASYMILLKLMTSSDQNLIGRCWRPRIHLVHTVHSINPGLGASSAF
jgi:hypothetical protein